MTDLRKAAMQLALEALEDDCLVRVGPHSWERKSNLAITLLHAALAEPEQEPVAWYCSEGLNRGVSLKQESPEWMPLYTAPTPRKPLTDEEIVRLMVGEDRVQLLYAKPGDPGFSEFAEEAIRELVESGRAIEKAHGIGDSE